MKTDLINDFCISSLLTVKESDSSHGIVYATKQAVCFVSCLLEPIK
jgi:hypothetical protein